MPLQEESKERISARKNSSAVPFMRIKLAPLNIPRHRRLETLAALAWISSPFILGPLSWFLIFYLIIHTTIARYFAIAYLFWMYMDKETCERGGRRFDWFRRLSWWQHYKNYFPVRLVATAPLPPDRNYLFAVYPHGILSSGAFSAFATDAHDLKRIMPGIKPYTCTLKMNFDLPIAREAALAAGLVAASKDSLNWILGSPGKGRAAILVVGGAAESFNNEPGVYKIVLKHRKGFCRVALTNGLITKYGRYNPDFHSVLAVSLILWVQRGSPLVPVFSFGEIDVYDQYIPNQGSWIDSLQHWVKNKTGVAPIMFHGRGIFQYSYGFVPKRVPVTVVIGKPIDVEHVINPTEEQVDALHKKFIESIIKLFNEQKHKYLEDPDTDLIIE